MKYVYIFEDDEPRWSNEGPDQEELQAFDDGTLQICLKVGDDGAIKTLKIDQHEAEIPDQDDVPEDDRETETVYTAIWNDLPERKSGG